MMWPDFVSTRCHRAYADCALLEQKVIFLAHSLSHSIVIIIVVNCFKALFQHSAQGWKCSFTANFITL